MSQPDRYFSLRIRIKELFTENRNRYGHRRIHALLKREDTIVSEEIALRKMQEENLVVKAKRTAKYNSYAGELAPSVPNEIERGFSAEKPNNKWLADITGLAVPAGEACLSPIVGCSDGLLVSWRIGTAPGSSLVNTMLDDAATQSSPGEKPIVHSDRGTHYRWAGWIERMDKAGLTRSMSKKGCPPDNPACEGVFGRIKNEMFYNTDWKGMGVRTFS